MNLIRGIMGMKEVESPEVVDGNNNPDSLFARKKLGVYFMESDDCRRTPFGSGYTAGGTTPVNIHHKPITHLSKTGGWLAAFFIFGNNYSLARYSKICIHFKITTICLSCMMKIDFGVN